MFRKGQISRSLRSASTDFTRLPSPRSNDWIALAVTALGTLTSKGIAFSAATRTSSIRTASETESPIAASDFAARSLVFWSIRVCTIVVMIWSLGYDQTIGPGVSGRDAEPEKFVLVSPGAGNYFGLAGRAEFSATPVPVSFPSLPSAGGHAGPLQVETPKRGNSQRVTAIHAAITSTRLSQEGTTYCRTSEIRKPHPLRGGATRKNPAVRLLRRRRRPWNGTCP